MYRIIRTDASDTDFISLVKKLDAELAYRDGQEHAFYDQFNKIDDIKYAVVLRLDSEAVGCGAIKKFETKTAEVKRMYVVPEYRSQGLARKILAALENWALDLHFEKCILETGKRQPEAIRLYKKNGYKTIPNYGQYKGVENSLCFEKSL